MTHAPEPDPTDPTDPAEYRAVLGTLKSLRLFTFAALAVALIAVGLAVVGWFRPPGTTSPTFTDEQTADAKANVCTTFTSVRQAVVTNTNQANPVEGDAVGALAVASNARLALYGGGGYLRDRLAKEPASPADLTAAVNAMANTLQDLSISYLLDIPGGNQDSLLNDLNSEMQQIDGLCA